MKEQNPNKAFPEPLRHTTQISGGQSRIFKYLVNEGYIYAFRVESRTGDVYVKFFKDQPDPTITSTTRDHVGWTGPWATKESL